MIPRITYYYQTFNGLKPILYPKTPVTHIHLSSVHFHPGNNGSPQIFLNDNTFDDPDFDSVWQELEEAQKLGIKIILMVGGAGGAYTTLFDDYNNYYPLLLEVLNNYPVISGIDLDIEEGVELSNVKKLINNLIDDRGDDFYIAMAPLSYSLQTDDSGMGGFCYKTLYQSPEGLYIRYFNGQFYGSYQVSDYDKVVKNGYPAQKVVMGMLGGEDFDSNLKTLQQLAQKYPKFGGAFIWEYCDAPDNWAEKVYQAFHPDEVADRKNSQNTENIEDKDIEDIEDNEAIENEDIEDEETFWIQWGFSFWKSAFWKMFSR